MNRSTPTTKLAPLVLSLLITMVLPFDVLAGTGRGGPVDITATATGRLVAQESANRFTAHGVDVEAESLRVFDLGNDGMLVAPSSATYLSSSMLRGSDGVADVQAFFAVGGSGQGKQPAASDTDVQPLAAPYWQLQYNGCFARWYVDSAYVDACYKVHKLINDGVADKDYFALQHWAVATETAFGLRSTWINSVRNGGAAQAWADWDPRVDWNINCQTKTVGVDWIAVITSDYTLCEDIGFNSRRSGRFDEGGVAVQLLPMDGRSSAASGLCDRGERRTRRLPGLDVGNGRGFLTD